MKAALAYIDAHESTGRIAKHAEQWRNTLASTYPSIGILQVRNVGFPMSWAWSRSESRRLRPHRDCVAAWSRSWTGPQHVATAKGPIPRYAPETRPSKKGICSSISVSEEKVRLIPPPGSVTYQRDCPCSTE
jgi:hypothetical protein